MSKPTNYRNRVRPKARGKTKPPLSAEALRVLAASESDKTKAARLQMTSAADRLHELYANCPWFLFVGVKHDGKTATGFVLYAKRKLRASEKKQVQLTWDGVPVEVVVSGVPKPATRL